VAFSLAPFFRLEIRLHSHSSGVQPDVKLSLRCTTVGHQVGIPFLILHFPYFSFPLFHFLDFLRFFSRCSIIAHSFPDFYLDTEVILLFFFLLVCAMVLGWFVCALFFEPLACAFPPYRPLVGRSLPQISPSLFHRRSAGQPGPDGFLSLTPPAALLFF